MRTFTVSLILNSLSLFSCHKVDSARSTKQLVVTGKHPTESSDNGLIEGTVVSVSRATLVVRIR